MLLLLNAGEVTTRAVYFIALAVNLFVYLCGGDQPSCSAKQQHHHINL